MTSLQLTPVDGHEEHGADEDHLHVDELERVDGGDAERGRLLVRVVQLVEVFVEKRRVVHPVRQVRQVVLQANQGVSECMHLAPLPLCLRPAGRPA